MAVRPSLVTTVLVLAVLGVSLSGPLVRISDSHPITIASWRLIFSLVILAVPLVATGTWRQLWTLDRRMLALAAVGGGLLALHFWSWNSSVDMTTIAASVVLVNVQPLVVGALSTVWLREPPSRHQWIGIGVAVLGAAVVVAPDLVTSVPITRRALLGDALALVGAITAACYYTIGRRVRATLDVWPYVTLVYGACLLTLLALAVAMRVPIAPNPSREYAIFGALALGPMLLGHTGMNWALKHARAYQVNIVLLGEPVAATFLAAIIPGIEETPTGYTLAGGALVLCGILLAERQRRG